MNHAEFIRLAKDKFTKKTDIKRIQTALEFATEKHAGQKRLSGEDYISHPIAVANILMEWDMDIDSVIAGLLHDVAEDTDVDLSEIADRFGKDVALLVDGVTKVSAARAGRGDITTYLPSTKDNLTKLLVATGSDIRVIIIKLADRLHNLRTLEHQTPERQQKKARESLEVFGPLADRLNMGRVRVEIEDISFRYIAPKRYNKLRNEIDQRLGASKKKLDKVRAEVAAALDTESLAFEMDGRIKSVYSLHKKLDKKQMIDDVYDLIALRVIVDDIPTCYLTLGLLHQLYTPLAGRIKDYIARPKPNGYQTLHTTVETDQGQIVEFQIRTHEMHEYAERGLAASFHYNEHKLTEVYKKGGLAPLPTSLMWIKDLQEAAARLRAGEKVDFDALKINLFSDRIFIYTPHGDIFDLPAGALPLDFAYQVHSELAARASGFRINGKIAKFDTKLRSGDVVEVLTRRNILPNLGWLRKITTPHARNKLRSQLRKENIDVAVTPPAPQAKKMPWRRNRAKPKIDNKKS
ncbi:MAG: RelA/SpoT family protein [Sphaerimonospora mesophila]